MESHASNGFLLTMQHNERSLLPKFFAHYTKYFRHSNIYVIDHGSDTNLVPPEANTIRVPRNRPYSEVSRRDLIAHFCSGLLKYYDFGIYADCDELIDLQHFHSGLLNEQPVVYVAGFDVFRANLGGGVRLLGLLNSQMCKPLIFSKCPDWLPGFHGCRGVPGQRLELPMAHLKYLEPKIFFENSAERVVTYQGMSEEEKGSGIARHWGEADRQFEFVRNKINSCLAANPAVEKFSFIPSKDVFEFRHGGFFPKDAYQPVVVDLTDHFPSL